MWSKDLVAWGQWEKERKETCSEIQWRTISRRKSRHGAGEERNRESVGWKTKHVICRCCYMDHFCDRFQDCLKVLMCDRSS